ELTVDDADEGAPAPAAGPAPGASLVETLAPEPLAPEPLVAEPLVAEPPLAEPAGGADIADGLTLESAASAAGIDLSDEEGEQDEGAEPLPFLDLGDEAEPAGAAADFLAESEAEEPAGVADFLGEAESAEPVGAPDFLAEAEPAGADAVPEWEAPAAAGGADSWADADEAIE